MAKGKGKKYRRILESTEKARERERERDGGGFFFCKKIDGSRDEFSWRLASLSTSADVNGIRVIAAVL